MGGGNVIVQCSIKGLVPYIYERSENSLREAITESGIGLPIGHSVVATDRRGFGVRAWILTTVLFLVPLVTYWPATFHDYGLRDDYSNLREAHEEPGTVVKFCASTRGRSMDGCFSPRMARPTAYKTSSGCACSLRCC